MILNGWGLGESHLGGYAEKARVKGDWLVRLPQSMSTRRGDGDRHGRLYRDAGGHGARARRRYTGTRQRWSSPARPAVSARSRSRSWRSLVITVIASTGRPAEADYLKGLGATEVIERKEFTGPVDR